MARSVPQPAYTPYPLGPENCGHPAPLPGKGGFVRLSDDANQSLALGKTLQFFGNQTCDTSVFWGPIAEPQAGVDTGAMQANGAQWYTVSIQGIEVIRSGAGEFEPLQQQEVGQQGQRWSMLKAFCTWNDGSYKQRGIIFDVAGGVSFPVYGRNVNVGIVVPENTILTTASMFTSTTTSPPKLAADPFVFDTVVSASVKPSEYGTFGTFCPLSLTYCVDSEGAAIVVPANPSGARTLEIYQAGGIGAPVASYEWLARSTTLDAEARGTMMADASGAVRPPVRIPGSVNAIAVPAGGGIFNFVYEICP